MNYMKDVAKMLGVELGEEFHLKGSSLAYHLCESGLSYYDAVAEEWCNPKENDLEDILAGRAKIVKKPWIPKKGDTYVWINEDGEYVYYTFCSSAMDIANLLLGNCFSTAGAAMSHKDEIVERYQKILDGKLRAEFVEVG